MHTPTRVHIYSQIHIYTIQGLGFSRLLDPVASKACVYISHCTSIIVTQYKGLTVYTWFSFIMSSMFLHRSYSTGQFWIIPNYDLPSEQGIFHKFSTEPHGHVFSRKCDLHSAQLSNHSTARGIHCFWIREGMYQQSLTSILFGANEVMYCAQILPVWLMRGD